MRWANFHTHSNFCDGVGEPQGYVVEAIKQGVAALGFSSHAPLPFSTSWHMPPGALAGYCQTVRRLQQENAGRLPIFLGLEIDFIPGVTSPQAPRFQPFGLDYTIGSVHFVDRTPEGVLWEIDGHPESFARGLEEGFGGDIRRLVESYYGLIREMVQTACPDVIGHFDVIKKNNPRERYFSETEPWYKEAVFETLDVIAASQRILEVNTGGIVRKRTDALYPSPWILERCLALDIPVTLSSDAHMPEHVTAGFDGAADVLWEIGFREVYQLSSTGWGARPLKYR